MKEGTFVMWLMCLMVTTIVAIVSYNKGWHEGNKHGYFVGFRCRNEARIRQMREEKGQQNE